MLGHVNKWKGHGNSRAYVTSEETMMYIPILDTISALLKKKTFIEEVSITLQ